MSFKRSETIELGPHEELGSDGFVNGIGDGPSTELPRSHHENFESINLIWYF